MNRPAGLNRALLALTGLLLAGAGTLILLVSLGFVPTLEKSGSLVPGTGKPPGWVLILVAVGAALVGLLCLRWILAQALRRPKTHTWQLERDPRLGRTRMSTAVAARPLAAELSGYAGVQAASATLAGPRDRPRLTVRVRTDAGADLADLCHRVADAALPRLRHALGLPDLPATVEFHVIGQTKRTPKVK